MSDNYSEAASEARGRRARFVPPNPNLEAAVQAYAGGEPTRGIQDRFRISNNIVLRELAARGIPTRRGKLARRMDAAIEDYLAGMPLAEITAKTGFAKGSIYFALKSRGIAPRRFPERRAA